MKFFWVTRQFLSRHYNFVALFCSRAACNQIYLVLCVECFPCTNIIKWKLNENEMLQLAFSRQPISATVPKLLSLISTKNSQLVTYHTIFPFLICCFNSLNSCGFLLKYLCLFSLQRALTWKLENAARGLSFQRTLVIIRSAFKKWEQAVNINFFELNKYDADIIVEFTTGQHAGDPYPFDGKGGDVAHSFFPFPGYS